MKRSFIPVLTRRSSWKGSLVSNPLEIASPKRGFFCRLIRLYFSKLIYELICCPKSTPLSSLLLIFVLISWMSKMIQYLLVAGFFYVDSESECTFLSTQIFMGFGRISLFKEIDAYFFLLEQMSIEYLSVSCLN